MKIGLFKEPEDYAKSCNELADAIERNGLRIQTELLDKARRGIGRKEYLAFNKVSAERADQVWAEYIDWLEKDVKYLKARIRKLRREAAKALAEAAGKGA